MPFDIEWHATLPNTHLTRIHGQLTAEEIFNHLTEVKALGDAHDTLTIHAIYLVSDDVKHPPNFLSLISQMFRQRKAVAMPTGHAVVVGGKGISQVYVGIVSNVFQRIHTAKTQEEAEAIIRQQVAPNGEG